MKKVLVVCALLGAMLLVDWLGPVGASAASSLAGMGFVMLAAYAVAEIGAALSLPLVTGYILAGLALGPSIGGIISGELIGEMRMFNTLALGLIATSAGLELDVRQVGKLMRTLLWTTLIKVIVGVSLVALALIATESSLGLLDLDGRGQLATLALVLGVLSVGTSPSIALAVLSETKAKGRLSELVLGAAVFKDLVVVIGLAVATAVGRVWLSPGAAADSSVLSAVALELGGSIAAGAVVGGIFILYVRFIRAEMLLFIAAMILVVAELCRAFHLELLLVFIAAGFVVRNASPFEHELMRPLRLVALPVFVLFFANAGASVDLVTTYEILPIALAICVTRAGVYALASHVGGRWAGESRGIRQQAWLAYLPQAGVTLGLVGVAALQLPELAGPITNTGMAVVALNLLVGPITLRRALAQLGEIPRPEPEASAAVVPEPTLAAAAPHESSPRPPAPLPAPLQRRVDAIARELMRVLDQFDARVQPGLPALPELGDTTPELDAFQPVVVAQREKFRELYTALLAPLGALPSVVQVEVAESGLPRRTLPQLRRTRKVPLRRVARIALAPSLAQLVARRFEGGLIAAGALHEASAGGAPPEPRDAARSELELGLARLAELSSDVGRGQRRSRSLRYSQVEPEVRRALLSLTDCSDAELARLARAAWGTAALEAKREHVVVASNEVIQRLLVEPARATAARISPAVDALAAWLDSRLEPGRVAPGNPFENLREEFETLVRTTLGEIAREFRFAATVRATLGELLQRAAGAPDSIECLRLEPGAALVQGRVQSVRFRAHVEALIRHLMPPIELAARNVASALNQLPRRLEDAVQHEWPEGTSESTGVPSRSVRARNVARRSLLDAAAATVRGVDGAVASLEFSLQAAYAAFAGDLTPGPARDGQREPLWRRWRERLGVPRRLSRRFGLGRPRASLAVDAETIRHWLHTSGGAGSIEAVERWFEPAPVSDERIFAGHRRLLDEVLDADGARASLGRASLLVVGSSGAGKSSLLNLCELELPYATHLRLHAAEFPRDVTLFEAMGTLLDCPPTAAALGEQLEERAPAIFVDDLPSWVSVCADRGAELDRVLQLIARTSHRAFWVASIESTLWHAFRELVVLEEVFTHRLRLPRFSREEVQRMIESRVELMGTTVEFPPSGLTALVGALRSASSSGRFYDKLWRASRGHPGRAIALCRQAFSLEGDALALRLDAIEPPGDVPFELTSAQLAALATLRRFGAQPLARLAEELAVSLAELRRSIGFLATAGLVTAEDAEQTVSIAPAADWAVQQTLLRARLAVED
ncbi:MAG TPA: cation:proton antiporter [Polyangiaceae bacterium]|nr:cation:proton antiporter [Polyangiaceae bacterium]